VLLVAAALWGAVVGIAAFEDAFARFEGSTLAALALFVSVYAAVAFHLDAGLREYAAGIDAVRIRALAAVLGFALLGALIGRSTPLALFVAPLATLAGAAAAHGPRRAATSASSAKSPAATRAAT
jgi:hypothetical protein